MDEENTNSSIEPSPSKSPTPRRRSLTIPTTTNGHHHHHTSLPLSSPPNHHHPFDYEFLSLNSPTYISLRDLISPSSYILLSPPSTATVSILSAASTATSAASGYEIGIRNRLVKQAAWAYLQPMSTSPSSSRSRMMMIRGCGGFLPAVVAAGGRWIVETASRVWCWLEETLWFLLCR